MNVIVDRPRSIGELILCCGGPIIWAGHLATLYGAHAVLCTPAAVAAADMWLPIAVVVTMLTVLGLCAIVVAQLSFVSARGQTDETRSAFLRKVAIALSVLSGIGIVWLTLPVTMVVSCR